MSDNFEQWKAEDGIIDAEMFLAQKIKILWVLREPNGSNFDYMKYLKNPTVYNKWKASFGLVVQTSYAILNQESNHKLIPNPSKIVHDIMPKIAIMNIKKTGGKANINADELLAYSVENQENIQAQILDIFPDLIVFAGTKKYVSSETIKGLISKLNKPVKMVSSYHPNQKKITHKEYIQRVLHAVNNT